MKTFSKDERKLIHLAFVTRIIGIIIQLIGNFVIPDHDAGVFLYPKSNSTQTLVDKFIEFMHGGFIRWDGQYFMHIIKYGYTYENTLAFFPLYPLLVKMVGMLFSCAIYLNEDSVYILSFLFINCFFFIQAAITLYRLSCIVLNKDLAYKSAVLFCINPATVFFMAPYSECLFCYLTFKAMQNYAELKYKLNKDERIKFEYKYILYVIPYVLSTCARSNGLLNLGFIIYFFLFASIVTSGGLEKIIDKIISIVKCFFVMIITMAFALLPFIFIQVYDYRLFCKNFDHSLPQFLVNYGEENGFRLPGKFSAYNQSWCYKQIPLAYSYVQEYYWNVGFLRYYEFKQIPNFLLAAPLVFIILKNSFTFFKEHRSYSLKLGLLRSTLQECVQTKFEPEMFVFVIHSFVLTLFCILFIHIQVTTRILCSASPVLYWFCAYEFKNVQEQQDSQTLQLFILSESFNKVQSFIKYYFIGYFTVGIVLFCNFLPWT